MPALPEQMRLFHVWKRSSKAENLSPSVKDFGFCNDGVTSVQLCILLDEFRMDNRNSHSQAPTGNPVVLGRDKINPAGRRCPQDFPLVKDFPNSGLEDLF